MGLEQVVSDIRAKAEAEAGASLEKARREATLLLDAARAKAGNEREAKLGEARERAVQLKKQELAAGELEAKKLRLAAQKDILEKVREAANERIAKAGPAERKRWLQALTTKSSPTGGRIWVAEPDASVAAELKLKVSGTTKGLGGLIIESADGSTREDVTYESLLDDAWKEALNEVAKNMFEGN